MGYSVLYIAFGIVALWLLGEVLLQYKARLRWRLLAFAGFMGVVGGVALREVVIILLGAIAFGTARPSSPCLLSAASHRLGAGRPPRLQRRRKGSPGRTAEPVLEVTQIEQDEFAWPWPRPRRRPARGRGIFLPRHLRRGRLRRAGHVRRPGHVRRGRRHRVYSPSPSPADSGEYPIYDGQSSYTPTRTPAAATRATAPRATRAAGCCSCSRSG